MDDGVGFVDEREEEVPGHGVELSPGDDAEGGVVVAGEDDGVSADRLVVGGRVVVPDGGNGLVNRDEPLRDAQADVADSGVGDDVLDGGDVAVIDFDEGSDLFVLDDLRAAGCAVLEEVLEHELAAAAGAGAGLGGVVAAGLLVEKLDVGVGDIEELAGGVEGPDLAGVVESGAGAVVEGVVEHHAEVGW